tara:strand:- start:245 stop:2395 length:2151 start_codon:yes stop_codon:yes gene_type:complete
VASEYSVNIKLNTSQVKKDLKTIGDGISNLGKKQSRGAKQALSDAEKELKIKNTQLGLENKILRIQNSLGPLTTKNIHHNKVMAALGNAQLKTDQQQFDLARQSILLAEKEIQLKNKTLNTNKAITDSIRRQILLRGRDTGFSAAQYGPQQPMQGPRFPTGISSGLNFDRFTGKMLTGPAGSGSYGLRNLGRRFDMQSALISGGFPLLFGQGPLTAAAGAAGGGIGGMFGQMGGFAGGIAATAAVQSISNTLNSVRELGNALRKPTENIGLLTEKLSLSNTPTGDLIAKLEKLGMTSTAASILIEEFAERTGKTPEEVKAATKELEEFNKGMADLGLKISFIVSDVLGPAITLLNKLPLEGIAKFFMGRGFGFLNPGGALSPFKESLPQKKLRLEKSRGSGTGSDLPSNLQSVDAMANAVRTAREILPLRQALEIEQQRFTVNAKMLGATKEKNKLDSKIAELEILKKEAAKETNDTLDFKIEKLTAEVDLQRQIYDNALTLADPIKAQTIQLDQQMAVLTDRGSQIVALSQTIASSFEESFRGIINGTMSVQDAFRNMLNSIANHFINTAAKMAANQLQQGLLSMFGGMFGGFSTGFSTMGGKSLTTSSGTNIGKVGFMPSNPAFRGARAAGGPVKGGSGYLVGERGPEMFTPGVSGMITPNSALGGSTTVIVNVDASGSAVEGDEEQGRELGRLISAAVQSEIIQQKRPGGILA